MCGRFSLTATADTLRDFFQLKKGIFMSPRYNIAPSQLVPVLKVPGEIDFLKWGFLSSWMQTKEGQIGFINARSETISEKPSFKQAFQKRRCLVVADGYYEWKPLGKTKQPYYIHRKDRLPFAFAGIWEMDTCAILTTDAHTPFLEIHSRMPLILPPSTYFSWLNPASNLKQIIEPLLHPVLNNDLELYPISTKVNDPLFDRIECIHPLKC